MTVGNNGANTTYSGVISSANASATSRLVKTGSGTTTLANGSTYAGPTVIAAGTLKLAGNVFSDIGIKFNTVTALPGPAGVVPMTNWNQEPAGTAAQATAQALINSSGAASGASVTWNAPNTYNTGAPTTQNGYLLYSYLNQAAAGTETATVSNLPSSYTASGYTVYVYYNSNNTNGVTLNITGGSTTYGVCTANVATFVLSNGSSAATQVAGDYVEWSGMSVPTFTASLTQAGKGAGICGIEIVPNGGVNVLPVATPLIVASGATFDLGGANQQVASLSDYAHGPRRHGPKLQCGRLLGPYSLEQRRRFDLQRRDRRRRRLGERQPRRGGERSAGLGRLEHLRRRHHDLVRHLADRRWRRERVALDRHCRRDYR